MLESNRRGTMVLFAVVGIALLLFAASEAAAPAVMALLVGLYFVFLFAATRYSRAQDMAQSLMTARPKITAAARAATDLAHRGEEGYLADKHLLQDVGLIVDERARGGMSLRYARFVSLDDESIRPYVVINHPRGSYPQRVVVRFEVSDTSGEKQFVYEMYHMLREGENLIIPDYRLRLRNNETLTRTGTWDLQVAVDEAVVAVHQFNMQPSAANRLRQSSDGEVNDRLMAEYENLPASLEELLQNQGR